jgi:hypothetical protein
MDVVCLANLDTQRGTVQRGTLEIPRLAVGDRSTFQLELVVTASLGTTTDIYPWSLDSSPCRGTEGHLEEPQVVWTSRRIEGGAAVE